MSRTIGFAGLVAALLLFSAVAAADEYLCGLIGSGTLMADGADYSGTFMFGMIGSWEIDLDDSLWPGQSDSTARFEYIWSTFFAPHYDDTPGARAWYGYLDGASLPTPPRFTFETVSPGGTLAGLVGIVIMVRDHDGDGVLSSSEKHSDHQLTMTLAVQPALGTDYFTDTCGHGAMTSGTFRFANPPAANDLQIVGQVSTYSCDDPVESETWGTIKALFGGRDQQRAPGAESPPARLRQRAGFAVPTGVGAE
jgi:hypothetical protein